MPGRGFDHGAIPIGVQERVARERRDQDGHRERHIEKRRRRVGRAHSREHSGTQVPARERAPVLLQGDLVLGTAFEVCEHVG